MLDHLDHSTRRLVPLSVRFDHALLFASEVHRHQERKTTGIPYLSHLLGVAAIVLDYGGDEEMGIAALLHDAAEDQGGEDMLRTIERLFGARVAKIVDGCTDAYGQIGVRKPDWEERKRHYVERICHEDEETRFVSAADKLYNCRAIVRDLRQHGLGAFSRFKPPKEKVLWYYRALVNEYRAAGESPRMEPLLHDLDVAVTEMENATSRLQAESAIPS